MRRRAALLLFATLAVAAAWMAIVAYATVHGWGYPPLPARDDPEAFLAAAIARIDAGHRGNLAFRLIHGGEVVGEHYSSVGRPVDADTRFQAASLSKWVTATGILALADAGDLDLDAPVSRYLRRWKLPTVDFDPDGVTARRLLSHSAGLTDGLGYLGFAPGEPAQPLVASLSHAADAMPAADGRTRLGLEPGTVWRYSGGGYALLQLLIEEITGTSFETYMQRAVFGPLGMSRSTFDFDRAVTEPNLAEFFDVRGSRATHYRFAAPAAAGLYTTTADLNLFVRAHFAGEQSGLSPALLQQLRRPEASVLGIDVWGLGVTLYAPNGAGHHVIGHDGHNAPAVHTSVRVDPDHHHAIILLGTGQDELVARLGADWVRWQTGRLDIGELRRSLGPAARTTAAGWAGIALAAILFAWWRSARRRQRR